MSGAGSRSEGGASGSADRLAGLRVAGGVSVASKLSEGSSRLDALAEHGGYRAKFPAADGGPLEAVIVNTGGGVAGGDKVGFEARAGAGSRLTVSTVSAERIYRSSGADAAIDVRLHAGVGATLAWLPQATILFSGARLRRRIAADIAADARLLLAEATVFGRAASGETMGVGLLRDSWRIRRDGRLVFAEETLLDGDIGRLLARPAVAAGTRGGALLLAMAPDIEERRDAVRAALERQAAETGVSAWDGKLVVRVMADRLDVLQSAMRAAVDALKICAPPRAWTG